MSNVLFNYARKFCSNRILQTQSNQALAEVFPLLFYYSLKIYIWRDNFKNNQISRFFFLSCVRLRSFSCFLSYLSKQQNIRTLPQNRPATRTSTGFALFCGSRIIRTLRIKGFHHYITSHSNSLTSKTLCVKVEAQHVKTCCWEMGQFHTVWKPN